MLWWRCDIIILDPRRLMENDYHHCRRLVFLWTSPSSQANNNSLHIMETVEYYDSHEWDIGYWWWRRRDGGMEGWRDGGILRSSTRTNLSRTRWYWQYFGRDSLMDNDDVINLSSAHLAKSWGLLFQRDFQLFHLQNKTIGIVTRRLLPMHSHHIWPFPWNAQVWQEKHLQRISHSISSAEGGRYIDDQHDDESSWMKFIANIAAPLFPLTLFFAAILMVTLPWQRRKALYTIVSLTIGAPFYEVTFRDGFIGDIVTSTVRPLQDLAFTVFYFLPMGLKAWWTSQQLYTMDAAAIPWERSWMLHTVVLPACTLSPWVCSMCVSLLLSLHHYICLFMFSYLLTLPALLSFGFITLIH